MTGGSTSWQPPARSQALEGKCGDIHPLAANAWKTRVRLGPGLSVLDEESKHFSRPKEDIAGPYVPQ